MKQYPGGKKDALEHLDFAIKESSEMKMQPSLERAAKAPGSLRALTTQNCRQEDLATGIVAQAVSV